MLPTLPRRSQGGKDKASPFGLLVRQQRANFPSFTVEKDAEMLMFID